MKSVYLRNALIGMVIMLTIASLYSLESYRRDCAESDGIFHYNSLTKMVTCEIK